MDGLTLHKPNVHPQSEYIRSVIHFTPQWIQGILKELSSEYLLNTFKKLPHCFIRTGENEHAQQLEEIICKMEKIKNSSKQHDLTKETELKVLLLQALIIVYKLAQMENIKFSAEKTDKAEHAENIATYIQENYMHELTLDSIAVALSLSRSYVSRVFKEITGFTVMEYVMSYRLTQVKYLLETEPDKSLKDVAYASGFGSAAHFSRYFRDKVGVTAGEYRRKRLKIYNNKEN